MLRRALITIYYCRPQRSYAVFSFLVTVFLLFRRRQRWLLWTPLAPEVLVTNIRALGASVLKLAQVLAVFVGESHNHKAHHDAQLQIIRELHAVGAEVAVGLEMFRFDG